MRKLNLHWFCTQNHILEPFSVRRACTQCYVTSEPYPRPSQIKCQNVRETRKKIVIKCRGESFARCRVIARYVEGGGHHGPPPSLIRVKQSWILMVTSIESLMLIADWLWCLVAMVVTIESTINGKFYAMGPRKCSMLLFIPLFISSQSS